LIRKKDYAKSIRQSQWKFFRASVSVRVRLGSLPLPPCGGGGYPRSTATGAPSTASPYLTAATGRGWAKPWPVLAAARPHRLLPYDVGANSSLQLGSGEAWHHCAVALMMAWRKASWWRPCGRSAASTKVGRRRSLQWDGGICSVVRLGGAEKGREGQGDGRRLRHSLHSRRRRWLV
jgi:hypothetical protein